MTETVSKPPASQPSLKARVKLHIDHLVAVLTATYQHYRHEIGHRHVLSNLSPELRSNLSHVTDAINRMCENAGLLLLPEDVVLIAGSAMLGPLCYVLASRTYVFQLAIHVYFAFVYPLLVSLYDFESGDSDSAECDLSAWVLLSFWTLLERTVPGGVYMYQSLWYLVLKCGFSYGLFNPKIDGAKILSKVAIRPKLLPALGIDISEEGKAKRKREAMAKAKTVKAGNLTSETDKSGDAPVTETGAAANAEAAPMTTQEESDASTDSKDSSIGTDHTSGEFSFVEKSELEGATKEEAPAEEPKVVHLKIASIDGTDWKFPPNMTDFEGPYLVFDVMEEGKTLEEVEGDALSFLPPTAKSGKKVKTPAGALVVEEEEEGDKKEKTVEATTGAEAEPELDEEVEKDAGDKADAEEEKDKEKGAKNEDKEGTKSDETDTEGTKAGEEKDAEKEDDVTNEETKSKEEEDELEAKAETAEGKEEKSEEKAPKPLPTSASFAWPGTSLSIPVTISPPPTGESETAKEAASQRLLRVVAYDKRTIGSDAFFGAAYTTAPIIEEPKEDEEETKASLVLRDGRTKADDGGAARVGEVSVALRCTD